MISSQKAVLPPYTEPMIDDAGLMTLSWRRFFESLWNRTGGFSDSIYLGFVSGDITDATVSQLAEGLAETNGNVQRLEATSETLTSELEQTRQELRRELSLLQGLVEAANGQDLQASILNLAKVATTGAYADLSGTPTLSAVATSGAYADLTGKPSLATVATSGSYNDLINKPIGAYTGTPGVITGSVTIIDSGGTPRNVAVTT